MSTTMKTFAVLALICGLAMPAAANYNSRYGETGWANLPQRGMVSKNVWVGSWWAYSRNGIAYRQNGTYEMKNDGKPAAWLITEPVEKLSPAEKYDVLVGRGDKIEREKLKTFLEKVTENESAITSKILQKRELIRKLNKAIQEHGDEPGFDWKTTDDGKEYLKITEDIEAAEKEIQSLKPTVDTATEWEVINHGEGQFGVESWYGHCNAWSAAAVMEPEPRFASTVGGIQFTAGDVKGLLTELWMEISSSFYGSRNEYHGDEDSRKAVDFKDVTPAAFHIFFSDQIANKDRSFVIDRFTGSEVWNQPVKAFRSKVEVLNDGQPVKRMIKETRYGYQGGGEEKEVGEKEVYEVLVTTTIHWLTDGVPEEELTDERINNDIDDETFRDPYKIRSLWSDHVHIRTLTYTLWLSKAPDDADAEIIGDGEWNHENLSGYTQLHPDFLWQPQANVNNGRDYENEFLDYDKVVKDILPGAIKPADDPEVEPTGGFRLEGSVAIPDDDATGATGEITVSGAVESITEMSIQVTIRHTYVGDLQIRLIHPDGKAHVLKEFGSGGSDNDIERTWDIKVFKGLNANGTWKLEVIDNAGADTGTVDSAVLNFK